MSASGYQQNYTRNTLQVGESLSENQPDQLALQLHRASLNSMPNRASLSEQQHSQQSSKQRHRQPTSTTSRPAIAINHRPVTSRAPLQASHNASRVITVIANKSAYHPQKSINCGPSATSLHIFLNISRRVTGNEGYTGNRYRHSLIADLITFIKMDQVQYSTITHLFPN
jgi:hypothetical protein